MINYFKTYKIFLLTILTVVIFIPKFVLAEECPIVTIGLSTTNQKNKFNEVFALQMILSQYPNIYPDALVVGNFGPKTESAIKKLQADNGLNPNGVITEDTLDLICSQYYQCPFQSMIGRGDEITPEQKIEVKMLQYLLKYLPKVQYTGAVNGAIGAITEKAIIKFQTAYNLYPTEILDYETNQTLCNIFSKLNTEKLSSAVISKPAVVAPSSSSLPLKAICVAEPSTSIINQPVVFLSQVFGGRSPYKYQWGGYANGSSKTATNTFTSPGQYPVVLKITDATNKIVEATCSASVSGQNKQTPVTPPINIPDITIDQQAPSNVNVTIDMTSDINEITGPSDTVNVF
jgi:peptidoglycan hydrolase-like protein with peptidoglycan-binding domain